MESIKEGKVLHITKDLEEYKKNLKKDISKETLFWLNSWSRKKIHKGKSFRELLEYGGTTLWWFTDRWLHKTPYFRNSLVEIVSNIELINYLIDEKKPEKIVLDERSTLLEKIAYDISTQRGLHLEIKKKITFDFSGFFESVKPYIVESYLKKTKGLMRKLFSKVLYLFYSPKVSKRKVLVTTYAKCWTKLDGRKGDRLVDSVIKELKKKNEVRAIGFDWTKKIGLKHLFENKNYSIPFENYTKLGISYRVEKERIKLVKLWNELRKSVEFRSSLEYKGISLWKFMKPRLAFALLIRLPDMIKNVKIMEEIIEKEKPKVLFLTYESDALGRCLITAAKNKKVRTIAMQHGMITEFHPAYYHSKEDMETYPLADKTLVYGLNDKEILTVNCNYPKNRVVVTGQPRYDALVKSPFNKEKICRELGLDSNKKILVWATQPFGGWIDKKFRKGMVDAMKKFPELQLVIKLHPKEVSKSVYRELTKNLSNNIVIIKEEKSANELLYICDVMLTGWSTTALEAMIFDKDVITLNLTGREDPVPYAKSGAALGVYSEEKIADSIKKALHDKKTKENLEKNRKKFIEKYLYKVDGNSTKRVVKSVEEYL